MTFDEMCKTHYAYVSNLALRKTGHLFDAQDLTQTVMLKAFMAWTPAHETMSDDGAQKWLTTITRNAWIDEARKVHRTRDVSLDDVRATSDNATETGVELRELIEKTAVCLSPSHRAILLMVVQGYHYKEIVSREVITMGAVKGRIKRAREAFTQEWEKVAA